MMSIARAGHAEASREYYGPNVKGTQRSLEKIKMDYAGEAARLKDPLRCSVASALLSDTLASWSALEELAEQDIIVILSVKNRFRDGAAPGGYRDMNVNVRFRGLVCEVQLHAGPYLALKEGAHHSYELCRSLDLVGELEPSPQEDDDAAPAPRWLWCMLTVLRLFASMYCFAMVLMMCYFYGYGMSDGQWDGGIEQWDGETQTDLRPILQRDGSGRRGSACRMCSWAFCCCVTLLLAFLSRHWSRFRRR